MSFHSSCSFSLSATQSISTIELTSSQSTLSSYLPKSGINCLTEIPSIHIHQVLELNNCKKLFIIQIKRLVYLILASIASENRFMVKTYNNDSLFLASEGSTARDRLLWGSSRKFLIHLTDKNHQVKMRNNQFMNNEFQLSLGSFNVEARFWVPLFLLSCEKTMPRSLESNWHSVRSDSGKVFFNEQAI